MELLRQLLHSSAFLRRAHSAASEVYSDEYVGDAGSRLFPLWSHFPPGLVRMITAFAMKMVLIRTSVNCLLEVCPKAIVGMETKHFVLSQKTVLNPCHNVNQTNPRLWKDFQLQVEA